MKRYQAKFSKIGWIYETRLGKIGWRYEVKKAKNRRARDLPSEAALVFVSTNLALKLYFIEFLSSRIFGLKNRC